MRKAGKVLSKAKCNGFTLIELLIVIVIIGILLAVAIPGYNTVIAKTRRSDAEKEMENYAAQMERYYSTNGRYSGTAGTTALVALTAANPNCSALIALPSGAPSNTYYTFTGACSDTQFKIRATPTAGKAMVGDGFLELDNTGLQSWDKNNDGTASGSSEHHW